MGTNILKQVKSCFFAFRDNLCKITEIFPVLAFIGTVLILLPFLYVKLCRWWFDIEFSDPFYEGYDTLNLALKHYFDTSLCFILLMLTTSRNYSRFAWLCFWTTTLLWLLNAIYITFSINTGLYYTFYIAVIFGIFIFIFVKYILITDK